MPRKINTCGIYKITNITNGKVYVGSSKSIENRVYNHKRSLNRGEHHSPTLQRAWVKHGADAFLFEVIIICAPKMLVVYEQAAIDFFAAATPANGYNIAPEAGRPAPMDWTPERRKASSEARIGKPVFRNDPERMARLVANARRGEAHHAFGKPMPEEVRQKMSESKKGKPSWDRSATQYRSLKGVPRSEAVKQKIAEAKRKKACPYAKLTPAQVVEIRECRAKTGLTYEAIGLLYSVTAATIGSVVTGKNWPNVGGPIHGRY